MLAATLLISERLVTSPDAAQTWFLFVADDELTINPAAVAKLKDNAGEVLSVAADVLGQLEQWNAELIHEALSTALVGGMGSNRSSPSRRSGWRSPASRSRRRCSNRWRFSARTPAWRGSGV